MNSRLDAEQARVAIDITNRVKRRHLLPIAARAILVGLGLDGESAQAMVEEAIKFVPRTQPEDDP